MPGLERLVHLRLSRASIDDEALDRIAFFRHLTLLEITGTAVTPDGIRHLHRLPKLDTLWLGRDGVESTITDQHLRELAGLKIGALYLTGCRQLTGEGLAAIRQLPTLKVLRLQGCPIGDAGRNTWSGSGS